MTGSPTQGAWDCAHGVSSYDHCDECYSPVHSVESWEELRRAHLRLESGEPGFDSRVIDSVAYLNATTTADNEGGTTMEVLSI